MSMSLAWGLGLAVGAALTTDRLVPPIARAAERRRWVDGLGERKVHQVPVPRLGGVAIAAGLAATVPAGAWLLGAGPGAADGLLIGGAAFFALGLVDDFRPLRAGLKLGCQIAAAAAAVALGVRLEALPGGLAALVPDALGPAAAALVSLGWLVAVPNALNLIDGLDGLAGGVALAASLALAGLALLGGQAWLAAAALALAGALAGFLRHNLHPARIFMGDAGSLVVGFALAALGLLVVAAPGSATPAWLPLLVLGVPLADTAFAVARRAWHRRPIFAPDRGHLHHLLLEAGGCQRRAARLLHEAALVLAGAALAIAGAPAGGLVAGAAAVALAADATACRKSQRAAARAQEPFRRMKA